MDILSGMLKKIYEPIFKKSCYRVDFYTPKPQVGEIYARKEIYIDSKTGKVLYEEDSFLFLEGGDLLPKSKTDFPKKDDINNKSTSIFIEETKEPLNYSTNESRRNKRAFQEI